MKEERKRNMSDKNKKILWGLAAGRCEFEGCNCILGYNPFTKEINNFAEIAHIRAVNEGGARYDANMNNDELNSLDNLMLMCAKCHKTIDDNPEEYTVDRLLEMKREHEDRVYWMTEMDNVQKTYMVGYFSNIDEYQPEYDNQLFCKAVINDKKIPSEKNIKNIGCDSSFASDIRMYYQLQEENIEKNTERVIKQCIQNNENISLFALAPIPLLIKLGEKFSDIPNVSVFQCHRNEDKWSWNNDNDDSVDFILKSSNMKNEKRVALNISLSAEIIDSRIIEVVGDIPIYRITIDNPNRYFVTNKRIIVDYIKTYRECIEQIKNENPDIEEILVFPAMPNSLAVKMGMDYMPKCDPKMIIFDQIKHGDRFIETIRIGG